MDEQLYRALFRKHISVVKAVERINGLLDKAGLLTWLNECCGVCQ